jgi:hypothetical protein
VFTIPSNIQPESQIELYNAQQMSLQSGRVARSRVKEGCGSSDFFQVFFGGEALCYGFGRGFYRGRWLLNRKRCKKGKEYDWL